jgi:hypothetical protein
MPQISNHARGLLSKKDLVSLLSHKNVQLQSLAWHKITDWLQKELPLLQPTVWILPDSVPAHAWLARLKQSQHLLPTDFALLGGDFPPAQERRWKQQLHQGTLNTVVLTVEMAEKWLGKSTISNWVTVFKTLTWVDCLPSVAVLKTLMEAPHQPQLRLLNPPLAIDVAVQEATGATTTPSSIVPSLVPPLPATGRVHTFPYAVLSEDALLHQIKSHFQPEVKGLSPSPFIIVCKNEAALLACQKLLGDNDIEPLALSASMPWVLFQYHLQAWFLNPHPILLIEESSLSAWHGLLSQKTALLTPLQWIWLHLPPTETTMSHLCEGLPVALQVDCHFVKEKAPFQQLPLVWQWVLLHKKTAFNPQQPLPQAPPLSEWSIWAKLNRLLYL